MMEDMTFMPLEEIAASIEDAYGITVHHEFFHTASMVHIHVPGTLSMQIDLADDGITFILANAPEATIYAPRDRNEVVAGILDAAARTAAAAQRAKKTTAANQN